MTSAATWHESTSSSYDADGVVGERPSGQIVQRVFSRYRISWLMHAAVHRRYRVVDLLLNEGANVSVTNDWGWTALHFAAVGGSEAVAWRLLQSGAQVDRLTGGPSLQLEPIELARHYENGNLTRRLQYALDIQYWRRSGRG